MEDVSDRQRRPGVLGEYELEGGAFGGVGRGAWGGAWGGASDGVVAAPWRERGDQRNMAGDGGFEQALGRPRLPARAGASGRSESLWRAVLRRAVLRRAVLRRAVLRRIRTG
jgi:hypothetical protein